MQTRNTLPQRRVTWFARFVAAEDAGNTEDAEDCRRHLATLGIWVDVARPPDNRRDAEAQSATHEIRQACNSLSHGDHDTAHRHLQGLRDLGLDIRLASDLGQEGSNDA